MAWFYLLLAGVFEIGWPVGLKMAQDAETRVLGITLAVGFMALSGFLLWLAQKEIPIGTSYAIWTGIGARVRSWSAFFIMAIPAASGATSAWH